MSSENCVIVRSNYNSSTLRGLGTPLVTKRRSYCSCANCEYIRPPPPHPARCHDYSNYPLYAVSNVTFCGILRGGLVFIFALCHRNIIKASHLSAKYKIKLLLLQIVRGQNYIHSVLYRRRTKVMILSSTKSLPSS
jgi:hypothetical protein